MPIAESLLTKPVHAPPEATARDAARLMKEHQIGSVVVTDHDGAPIGIVTDRDLALGVLGDAAGSCDDPLSDLMTPNPTVLSREDSLVDACRLIRRRRVRRLPVVDEDGVLVGLVSADDLVFALAADLRWAAEAQATGFSNETRPRLDPPSIFGKE